MMPRAYVTRRSASSALEARPKFAQFGLMHFGAACLLAAFAASGTCADDRYPVDLPALWTAQAQDAAAAEKSNLGLKPTRDAGKSYAIPALEILGFEALLNRTDRLIYGGTDYNVSLNSIHHNLNHGWVVDNDPYAINQFGHPYQGSIYHTLARSAGLNYWESAAYTFAGSALWEIAGETTPPSRNDQIASGIAGSFLGESLFRMANLIIENAEGAPRFWRELAAAAVSPATGFNRLAFGDRFKMNFASHHPAYYSRLQVGVSGATQNFPGTSQQVKRTEALADFSMDYGLPGKPGYDYTRPFDYFSFQVTASSANHLENIMTRGLLFGKSYEAGRSYRGVWGLYGSYDYIAPQSFRVSSTALSLGTTGQWWMSDSIALQGTGLLGAGYAAAATINGVTERDYHYGVAPQALLGLRFIFADKASLDATAREYFVSKVAGARRGGHDNIARADVSFTVRVHGLHAVSVRYLWTRRDAAYPDLGDRTQTRAIVGIFYTLLGHDRFGAVDWR
jgi:uncharacterized protein DUF3943